ncbi:flagellar biosynthetic protein FliR [Desulfuromonas versatilis]|uniref:Flagellar biosynthetic protein FliR n=1 Tax=Desulfuromonas versatilis TaxID=2802975 RepID=A0ABN6E2P6_9BACT|nr:flagellar biosynthetic protein FliR [Desulfuromonas versatilis]BCR06620.1 flagellar biosynthetic protein FliR [Desulfuromonas versatilis]
MPVFPLPIDKFELFLVCLARVGALMGSLPIFGTGTVPSQIRIGLALFTALVVYPVAEPYLPRVALEPASLAVLLGAEAILGLMVGFTARLVFTAVELGGTIIGYQMGFAAANVFDPQNQRQVSLISQFQNMMAILIFLALDVHHLFFEAIVRSYAVLTPGSINLAGEAVPFLMKLAGHMFSLGVQFSAPILAVLLLSGLVLGVLARVFPQLNVFLLSFPLNIGISFLVIGLTLNLVAALLSREFAALEDHIMALFLAL